MQLAREVASCYVVWICYKLLISNDDDTDFGSTEVDGVVEVGPIAKEAHVQYGVDEFLLVIISRESPLNRGNVTKQHECHLDVIRPDGELTDHVGDELQRYVPVVRITPQYTARRVDDKV